ncbi:MAG: ABC transporter permease [Tissierellia bacterium]|nr:ABC transporter permease [Tissierellia bacterium]
MNLFKVYLKIIKREPLQIILYLIIFIVLTILFSKTKDTPMSFEKERVNIGYINEGEGKFGNFFLKTLGKDHELIAYDDENKLKEDLYVSKIYGGLILNRDFDEKLINGEKEILQVFTDKTRYASILFQNQGEEILHFMNAGIKNDIPLDQLFQDLEAIETKVQFQNDDIAKSLYYKEWLIAFFNSYLYVLMMLIFNVVGIGFIEFQRKNIANRILVSGTSRKEFIGKSLMSQFLISFILILFYMPILYFYQKEAFFEVHHLPIIGNLSLLLLVSIGMVFFISNFTHHKSILNAIFTGVALSMAMISGNFVPREILSQNVIQFSKILPMYYLVNNMDFAIMNNRLDPSLSILLLLFFIFFIVAGLAVKKIKSRN